VIPRIVRTRAGPHAASALAMREALPGLLSPQSEDVPHLPRIADIDSRIE
jgi:hypothetical protein